MKSFCNSFGAADSLRGMIEVAERRTNVKEIAITKDVKYAEKVLLVFVPIAMSKAGRRRAEPARVPVRIIGISISYYLA